MSYFLKENDEEELIELQNSIEEGLKNKVDKVIARQLFSLYKKSPENSEEREEYRKKYLDHIGIHNDFRTDSEWIAKPPEN